MNFCLKITAIVLFSGLNFFSQAQEDPVSIKVRKEQTLVKATFDNDEMKLTVIDKYGNPRENKVVAYKLWVKGGNRGGYTGLSNQLTPEMLSELRRRKEATKIFFTGINVEDDEGHIIQLPDVIDMWFPECKNCSPLKKEKKSW